MPPSVFGRLPPQQRRGDYPQRADGLWTSIPTAASMTSSMCAHDGRSFPSEMIRAVSVMRRVPISRCQPVPVEPQERATPVSSLRSAPRLGVALRWWWPDRRLRCRQLAAGLRPRLLRCASCRSPRIAVRCQTTVSNCADAFAVGPLLTGPNCTLMHGSGSTGFDLGDGVIAEHGGCRDDVGLSAQLGARPRGWYGGA